MDRPSAAFVSVGPIFSRSSSLLSSRTARPSVSLSSFVTRRPVFLTPLSPLQLFNPSSSRQLRMVADNTAPVPDQKGLLGLSPQVTKRLQLGWLFFLWYFFNVRLDVPFVLLSTVNAPCWPSLLTCFSLPCIYTSFTF